MVQCRSEICHILPFPQGYVLHYFFDLQQKKQPMIFVGMVEAYLAGRVAYWVAHKVAVNVLGCECDQPQVDTTNEIRV